MIIILFFTNSTPAQAALRAKDATVTIEAAVNPIPAVDDFILPMPCNATMAFKAVGTQADGFLWDMQTAFGCDNCGRQNNDYYERRHNVTISGPFGAKDLPQTFTSNLAKPEVGTYYYYMMGKYEVSNFQWRAVMENWCPTENDPLKANDTLPKTNMSWFDAIEFSKTYTTWLLANAPQSLPKFTGDEKNIAFLRLPTETEWEYAARGGQAVPKTDLQERDFFSLAENTTYTDYAVFRPEAGANLVENLAPIGSRKPNPLGLYDTAGNAAEMVLDTFRFSLGSRLHGSAGGFVLKGGSYLSDTAGIMPGRREEAAFYQANGPLTNKDMGMRLVLSGINTPAGNRPQELLTEWQKAGEGSNLLLDQGKNPLAELDRLIASTNDSTQKENLQRLRLILKDNNIALERQNELAAEGLIRNALFMIETVRNYGVRHKTLVNMLASGAREREAAKGLSKAMQAEVEKAIMGTEKNRNDMELALRGSVAFYRSKIEESLRYPETMFNEKLALMRGELKGNDLLTLNLQKAHELYMRHVAMLRKGQQGKLTQDFLIKDILPDNLQEGLRGK